MPRCFFQGKKKKKRNEGKSRDKSKTDKKPTMTCLVIDGVKLGEDNSIDQAGLVGHGVVGQGLVKLNLGR